MFQIYLYLPNFEVVIDDENLIDCHLRRIPQDIVNFSSNQLPNNFLHFVSSTNVPILEIFTTMFLMAKCKI